MKLSELKNSDIAEYLRIDPNEETVTIDTIKQASIAYIKGYTGLDDAEIDLHEDITIACLVLCSDLYDNRQMTVGQNYENKTVACILAMHAKNYL